jgi:hypothetical protein
MNTHVDIEGEDRTLEEGGRGGGGVGEAGVETLDPAEEDAETLEQAEEVYGW